MGPHRKATSGDGHCLALPASARVADARDTQTKASIDEIKTTLEMKFRDSSHSLTQLNQEAVRFHRTGRHEECVAALTLLFERAAKANLTHPGMHTAHLNRAASLVQLGLYDDALQDCNKAVQLLKAAMPGGQHQFHPLHVKALTRRGQSLAGLGLLRQASEAFHEALGLDPACPAALQGLQDTQQQLLRNVLEGRDLDRCALPAPAAPCGASGSRSITFLPASTPAHRLNPGGAGHLPTKLLTPFQAERDVHTRDTYTFLTIQADIRVPKRYIDVYLRDEKRIRLMDEAVRKAVAAVRAEGLDCRVLVLGAGGGLVPMLALRAGAWHVTCVERWMYLAQSCREVMLHNGADPEAFKVICKRPSDLTAGEDVPVCCNLVVAADLLDDGLLTSGLLLAVNHALASGVATPTARVIPASIEVSVQALEALTPAHALAQGPNAPPSQQPLTLAGLDRFRWLPLPAAGVPLAVADACPGQPAHHSTAADPQPATCPTPDDAEHCPNPDPDTERCLDPNPDSERSEGWSDGRGTRHAALAAHATLRALSAPVRCWHFDLRCAPTEADFKVLDVALERSGTWNAVAAFASCVTLFDRVSFGTGFGCSGLSSLQPGLQFLEGALSVEGGAVMPLRASHNTISLRFDLDDAEYMYLHRQDASLPRQHFSLAGDTARLAAYQGAVERAAQRIQQEGQAVHALDLGCGSGALALLAAQAGAASVVGVEAHPALVEVARTNVALTGQSGKVSIVHGCLSEPELWRDALPRSGANLVVFDLFDEGLLGCGCLQLLAAVRGRALLTPGAALVPSAASLYCVGVESLTGEVGGLDLSPLNRFRWAPKYEAVRWPAGRDAGGGTAARGPPVRFLTEPQLVARVDFTLANGGLSSGGGGGKGLSLQALGCPGVLNAVVFWYDLHLDGECTLLGAPTPPPHPCGGGERLVERSFPAAALQYLDAAVHICRRGQSVDLVVQGLGGPSGAAAGSSGSGIRFEVAAAAAAAVADPADPASGSAVGRGPLGDASLGSSAAASAASAAAAQAPRPPTPGGAALQSAAPPLAVPRAPWLEEWGGGVSVENPHVQRAKYCELLVQDLRMRLPGGRGPSVEEDLKVMAAHCGSLYLDPESLSEALLELSLLERLYRGQPLSRQQAVALEQVAQRQTTWG